MLNELRPWKKAPGNIDDYQGFVYLLEWRGHRYIGKKNFWKMVRYKPLKGNKRVRRKKKPTDWESYLGSSNTFLERIKGHEHEVERTMLWLCETKWAMSYFELKEQIDREVLFDDTYENFIIQVRLNGQGRPKGIKL